MDWLKLDDEYAYTRKELMQLGLKVTATTFGRWEKAGLDKLKAPGRSSRVRYVGAAVRRFFKP